MPPLPDTIRRSPKHAQETFRKTLRAAEKQYGEGRRAYQTAYAALKHSFEKIGDHWEPKKHKGPSDARSAQTRPDDHAPPSAGGVDVLGHTRAELLERAKKLDITGRSRMNKEELGRAIARKQD